MKNSKMISIGGWSLIVFTVLYLGIQVYLMVVHNYPAIAYGPGRLVLPVLLSEGRPLAFVLTIFSLLPLLLIPGSVGAYYAFRGENEPGMRLATLFALITAFSLVICLMRWPSFNLYIAGAYAVADAGQRGLLNAMLLASNAYFGVYIGGFLASACATVWFFITAKTMLKSRGFPVWVGYLGIVAAVVMLLTLINNFNFFPAVVTQSISDLAPIDAVWLLVFGISLLAFKGGFED